MSNYLPNNIITEKNLINNAETLGAVLRRLPHLIKALRYSKDTSHFLNQLDNKLQELEKSFEQHEKETIKWMNDCLNKLKKSPFTDDPLVKPWMKRAEDLIVACLYDPKEGIDFHGYIDHSLNALCKVADAIASFGPSPLFDGWAEIYSGENSTTHDIPIFQESGEKIEHTYSERWKTVESFDSRKIVIPIFPKETKGNIPLTEAERKELKIIFNRNFECWFVEPPRKEKDKQGKEHNYSQVISLRYGFFHKFIYPPCIKNLIHRQSQKGKREWLELRDSEPITLYSYLKILEQYEGFECATLPPNNKIETWDDVERFNIQANTGLFLSCFSSEKPEDVPHTLPELKIMIDQFLEMVAAHVAQRDLIKGCYRKSMLSKQAEEYSIDKIVNHVKSLPKEKRAQFTYKKAFQYVQHTAAGLEFSPSITETLVKERAAPKARSKLEEIGIHWKHPGGRPKKDTES